MSLIKAGFRLVAEQAALDHLGDELWHHEHLALRIVGQILVQISHDVREHVQAHEIESAKRRRLWPAGRGPGDLVHFLDRIAVVEHRANRDQRAERADAVGDKVWPILRDDHAFAQTLVEKTKHRTRDFGFGPFGANQFHQMHIARRIEEVHAEKVRAKIFRASFGKLLEWNTAGVRSNDRAGPALLLDLLVQAAFDFEVLDDCFDDQIAIFQLRQVVFKVSYADERSEIGSEEGRRL